MMNDHTIDLHTEAPTSELTEDQLEQVSGGTVVAPRDAASGMATGHRSH